MSKVRYEDVMKVFTDKNLTLLDDYYVRAKVSMSFYCEKHNYNGTVKWSDFKQGKGGCRKCNKENFAGRHSYEFVKNKIESRGFKLISEKYTNNKEYLELECNIHGLFKISFDSFQRSSVGCEECARIINKEKQKTPFEEVYDTFKEHGFTLLETEWANWNTPMKCICDSHPNNIAYISRSNVKKVRGCGLCKVQKMSGSNSHLWKGGITSESRRLRTSSEYKKWRNNVFKRDSYTCQCCNIKGGRLNAHHINNFSTHKELRMTLENGITMCFNCHSQKVEGSFHSNHTQFNNTLEQLQEYFNMKRTELNLPLISIKEIVNKPINTENKESELISNNS